MFYDLKLLQMCYIMTNICPICHENINNNECTLLCGHKYHYNCILMEFKHNYKRVVGYKNRCPYCRQAGGFLKLNKNTIPIEGIHIEYNEFVKFKVNNDIINLKNFLDTTKCIYIMKSGKNHGKQCTNNNSTNNDFCKRHSVSKTS